MKQNTAVMLLSVMRNVKGIITVVERWIKQEGKIGTVGISSSSVGDQPASNGED